MTHIKKIVFLGHFGVGKTSLIRRFVESEFSEDYLVTVGVHVKKKDVVINNETVSLIIWDIEGNTSINKARSSYLLGSDGFIYVFDVGRPETYKDLPDEMKYLQAHFKDIPVCKVGNKSDLFKGEFTEDFFKEQIYKGCIFTSAKTGENVEAIFTKIAQELL